MSKVKIPSSGLYDYAQKLFKQYDDFVTLEVIQIYDDIANETVKELKAASPVSNFKRKGKSYKASWTKKKVKQSGELHGYIIYNKKGQVTQLVEFGHPIIAPYYKKNGGAVIGHAEAHPHIKPVADKMKAELEKRVKERLAQEG